MIFVRSSTSASAPERLAALLNASRRPTTAESLIDRERHASSADFRREWIAEQDGEWVGFASASRRAYEAHSPYDVEVRVRPDGRGRGIGAQLWAIVDANVDGGCSASVRDDDPASLRFAEARGFAVRGHTFESVLDLETFERERFVSKRDAFAAAGGRVFSMAEVPDDELHRRKLWRLNAIDIPAEKEETVRPFERFDRDIFGGHWYRPEGQIVAALGDAWIGLSAVGFPRPEEAYNMITGVVPSHRGRDVATMLKLASIDFARREGKRRLRTHNDPRTRQCSRSTASSAIALRQGGFISKQDPCRCDNATIAERTHSFPMMRPVDEHVSTVHSSRQT